MSTDVSVIGPYCCDSHNHQFTGNYVPALQAVGMPSWRIMHELPAPFVQVIVQRGLEEFQRDRSRYEPLIRGNGEWGTGETLIESLASLLADLMKHPDGYLMVVG